MQIKIVRLREATFSAQGGMKKNENPDFCTLPKIGILFFSYRLSIKLEQGVVQPLCSYKSLIVAGVFT